MSRPPSPTTAPSACSITSTRPARAARNSATKRLTPQGVQPLEMFWLFVNLAPVCNASDRDELRRVVEDVQHAPVTGPDAPLVLVAFQLSASRGPGIVGQRQNLPVYAGKQRIVERIQFLLRRLLDFERVFNHEGACVSGGLRDIARRECPFPSGAIQTQGRPRSPPRWPRAFSGRLEPRPCGPSHP